MVYEQSECGVPVTPDKESADVILPMVLSVPQAARFTTLSEATIWRLLRRRTLEARKHGRRTLILRESAEAYVRGLPALGAAA